jgi:hypothetical protein
MLIESKNITVLTIYPSFGESDYQKQLKEVEEENQSYQEARWSMSHLNPFNKNKFQLFRLGKLDFSVSNFFVTVLNFFITLRALASIVLSKILAYFQLPILARLHILWKIYYKKVKR